jgi:hypothetical protein
MYLLFILSIILIFILYNILHEESASNIIDNSNIHNYLPNNLDNNLPNNLSNKLYINLDNNLHNNLLINQHNIITLDDIKTINNKNHQLFFTDIINNNELNKVDINKGSLSIQNNISEKGGSKPYNKLVFDTNISDNKINYNETYKTYTKIPNKPKKTRIKKKFIC